MRRLRLHERMHLRLHVYLMHVLYTYESLSLSPLLSPGYRG